MSLTCPMSTLVNFTLEVFLDDAILQRLDEIWPGRSIAPQAYAW
jgi:hypothetical protein